MKAAHGVVFDLRFNRTPCSGHHGRPQMRANAAMYRILLLVLGDQDLLYPDPLSLYVCKSIL